MDKRLLNKNRCAIFNYIIENPGKHFSEIMRQLKMTKRGLGYHLQRLIEDGIIVSKPLGRYYPVGADILPHFTPMQKKVVDFIKGDPCTTEEIAYVLDKTTKAMEYHVRNLAKMGVIRMKEDGWWHYRE